MTVGVNVVKANGLSSYSGWNIETGAAASSGSHSKMSDDNTATYLKSNGGASTRTMIVSMGTFTLGADEIVIAVRYRARVTQPATAKTGFQVGYYDTTYSPVVQSWSGVSIYNAGTITPDYWWTGPWSALTPDGKEWTQAKLNALAVRITEYKKNAADLSSFKEVWADVLVGSKPTAVVTLPVEASTEIVTNTPTLAVTADDVDDSVSTVTNKVLTSNVATLTLSGTHYFGVGEQVTVSGVDATFDGAWEITAVTSTTISYACTAANVASTADTGTVTSNRARWIGDALFRVFSAAQYGIGGFDPEASPCTFEALVAGGETPFDITTTSGALTNGTYRVYAKVTALAAVSASLSTYSTPQSSSWDYNQFTISIVPPESPVVAASFDATNNKVDVTINGRVNVLSEQDASLEATGVGTWVNDTNASSIARSTTDYSKGSAASLTFTATAGADCAVRTGNYAVAPSTPYRAVLDIKTPSATKSVRVDIAWYQADGATLISTSTGTATATPNTTAYATRTIDATSPANAAYARVRAYVVSATAGHAYRIDGIGLWPEQSGAWSPGGCTPSGLLLERSDDGGTTWATVVGGSALDGGTAQLVNFDDYTAPRGITTRYRATQTVLTAGALPVVSAVSSTATAATTNDGKWWLKAYTDPSLNYGGVRVLASPDYARIKEQSVDRPLGRTDGLAVVTTTTVGGVDASLKIAATGETEWAAVEALLAHNGPVLLQDPWGRQRWIALTGYSWVENGGVAGTSRTAAVGSIEVNEPV